LKSEPHLNSGTLSVDGIAFHPIQAFRKAWAWLPKPPQRRCQNKNMSIHCAHLPCACVFRLTRPPLSAVLANPLIWDFINRTDRSPSTPRGGRWSRTLVAPSAVSSVFTFFSRSKIRNRVTDMIDRCGCAWSRRGRPAAAHWGLRVRMMRCVSGTSSGP